ncbi:MAG: sugar phosphate isomerase/epimerase family protein [Promethearchaeota archaeon]|jgi:sugar phosphate isomerase/epimerase
MKSKIGGSFFLPQTFSKKEIELEANNFRSAGYDYAEIPLGLSKGPIEAFKDKLKTLRNIIPIYSGHLPQMDYKKEEIDICKRYIENFSDQGINLFVVHLFSIKFPTKSNLEFKIEKLRKLADFAENYGSILALENTEEEPITLRKVFNEIPNIDFCLDIGHANLLARENQSINFINNFGNLLKHIHIHDNIGGSSEKEDLHLPIGEGSIVFKPIFQKLKDNKYSGDITIELYKPEFETKKLSVKRLRELLD